MMSEKTLLRNYLFVSALLPIVLLCDGCYGPLGGRGAAVCSTPECTKRGNLYHKNMKADGKPCEDFFDYVCGGWINENPRPSYQLEWSVPIVMQRETLGKLRTILQKSESRSDSPQLKLAKKVYRVCKQIPSLGKGDADFVANKMKSVGFYGKKSLWEIHSGHVKLTGESPLFDIQIVANTKNNAPLILLKEKKSPYGAIVFLAQWTPEQKKIYHTFLVNLFQFIRNRGGASISERNTIKIVNDVLVLREKLNKISRASIVVPSDSLGSWSVSELQHWYNRFARQKTAQIDWSSLVQNVYSGVSDAAFVKNPTVGFRRKSYITHLAAELANTSEDTLAYHFELYFMERHMSFASTTIQMLDDLLTKDGFSGYARKDHMDRSLKCVEDINMNEVEAKAYVDNFFQKSDVPKVEKIIEDLKEAINADIMRSKWLDDKTKVASTTRVKDIKWWIGYPPWYDNPKLKKDSTFMNPAAVNAHLEIDTNRICINAAIMKSPIYDSALPDLINYATIGQTIAHEIYHALADCGTTYKNSGTTLETWWSNEMREKCQTRKNCFIEEYTKLAVEKLKSLHVTTVTPGVLEHTSETRQTYVEDLSDVMGLKAAYHAFQLKLKKQPNTCTVLPHFEHVTCDQMFFISFVNTMCGYQVPQIAFSTRRTHSPFHLRVNAALAHNEDFGRAFGCHNNTPMHAKKKCNLWV